MLRVHPDPFSWSRPDVTIAPVKSAAPLVLAALVVSTLAATPAAEAAGEDRWSATVSRVADSVVSLKLAQLRSFDDTPQGDSTATGFVVDAARGIVLTNRHVVGSGPIRISATFQNQERVDAVPLYRDPVHDFAFVRFDPAALRHAVPDSLALRPDKAATGLDIRVLGSDGGEQLSILPGTIARLDREVPAYARYGYNDFNTFYLQAASGTSGGSSGSPVIDPDGDVVALNAAANTRTASSFFLPLERVRHALEHLQRGAPIARGGLQTLFAHRPFRELERLGLDPATEARVRASDAHVGGMLVVEQVIPGGVAATALDAGDVLVGVDGRTVTDFVALEALLDASVGRTVGLDIRRQGAPLRREVRVADLHALAPSRLVELGDTVLQDMSIQHARAMNRPQRGVVVMQPGYFFTRADVPQGAVIVAVDGHEVGSLDDLLDAVGRAADASRMLVRYVVPGRELATEVAQVGVDDVWFGHRICSRVDDARFWDCRRIELPPAPAADDGAARVPSYDDALLARVAPATVRVRFHVPYLADNVYARHFEGVGIVVDAAAGLVAVDRDTVPLGLGDAELTFFGSRTVPARAVFLHPRHNVALLEYEPARLGTARPPALALAAEGAALPSGPGALTMVGLRDDGTFRRAAVGAASALTVTFPAPGLPRFQQSALDVYGIADVPPSLGGALVDASGTAHALYTSFAYEEAREIHRREWAMPIAVVREALALHRSGEAYRSLDATLVYRPLADARRLGLPDAWLDRYDALAADARRVLYVAAAAQAADDDDALVSGDVLLAIDGTLVSALFAAERLAQHERLALTVLRAGHVIELDVAPSAVDVLGTARLVSWGGALFQAPHAEIVRQQGVHVAGVYVALVEEGSPASWDGLWRNRFVVAVDGTPVADLDDFLAAVGDKRQGEITRLTTVSMSGRRGLVTLAPEYRFWPTFEVRRDAHGGRRIARHDAALGVSGRRDEGPPGGRASVPAVREVIAPEEHPASG